MALELASSLLSERTLSIQDLDDVIFLLERHHYSKTSYDRLGLRLKLSQNTLETIKNDHRDVHSCFTECLASWLRKADRVENPTIDTLIAALRGTGENAVADGINEERQRYRSIGMLRSRSEMEATPSTLHTSTSEGYSIQPVGHNPGLHYLEQRIDQVSELQRIADRLQAKYGLLVIAVKRSLKDHCVNVKDAKFLVKECLKRKARVVSELMPCINDLDKLNNFESFFDFLSNYDFIGYLNYKLLKKLSLLIDDNTVNQLFFEYEEEYARLLSATSFQDLIPFFREQSDLSPNAPLGLPYISFRLQRPSLFASIYSWISTFGQFSWSYYAFLKQLRENCIIITYAILPCVLDDVMRDLTDPVILKELKEKEVTVIELPQEGEASV
uniref:Death domain-containing protein n=1 Tax=Amphimedon queenslandica TaxID=400682 RepID=A0A1X7TAB3_AMPQE